MRQFQHGEHGMEARDEVMQMRQCQRGNVIRFLDSEVILHRGIKIQKDDDVEATSPRHAIMMASQSHEVISV